METKNRRSHVPGPPPRRSRQFGGPFFLHVSYRLPIMLPFPRNPCDLPFGGASFSTAAGAKRRQIFFWPSASPPGVDFCTSSGSASAVNDLARPFRMTRPAVSQHLRILLDAGLVSVRRVGRERRYRLRAAPLRAVFDWVAHCERFWTRGLKSLGEYPDKQARREKIKQGSATK